MTLENQLSLDDAVSSFAPTYETAPTVEEPGPPASSPDAGLFEVVPAALRSALEGRGFKELTPVQEAVMAAEAEGRDLQISSQTGSGKTVALGFVLAPALSAERVGRGPQVLIIVPTRELAAQVCEELRWLFQDLKDTNVISVTGGTPVYRDRQTLARNPRVLVGTPGRLLDHIKSGTLQLGGVRELVLDEADQMLDMGFREDLEAILDATEEPRRTHLVSATFPAAALRLAKRYQHNPFSVEGTRLGAANENITHEGYLVRHGERYDALVHLLLQAEGERILVFVERRLEALEVAERLADDGFAAQPLSGELVQAQRDRTLAAFRSGRATVLVATDVAARGLDVPDVGLVIHSTPPMNSEIYTHRSGRTGRAGKQGRSAVFAPPKHKRKVGRLLAEAGVEFRWCPTVEIGEVRAQLVARAQKNLETDLDEALLKGSSKEQVAQARGLLKGRDPVAVVATLLAQRHPAPQPKQAPSHSSSTYEKPAYKQSGSHKSNGFGKSDFHAGSESPFKSAPTQRFQRSAPTAGGRFAVGRSVRFFISYGSNQGANPSRVLAAVCRRGEVEGGMIGSIAVHPNACTFDVQEEVAMHFERCAGRRDPRDSKVVIRRDRSPGQAPRGARRGRGGYRRR
ncbi:MAG: DEAD/DEAH box helicase [Planctomycetota bacterium]|nr:DEAD/DEAH box helicase [Planctomycetota bacterium]